MASYISSSTGSAFSTWILSGLRGAESICARTGGDLSCNTKLAIAALALVVLPIIFLCRRICTRNLPPSPPGWPIIGHLHLLGLPSYKSLNNLSAIYGPIMYLRFGLRRAIIISSPELAREVFKNHDAVFCNRSHFILGDLVVLNQGIAFQSANASWRNLRKIFMMEIMSQRSIQNAQRIRAQEVDSLSKSILRHVKSSPNTPLELNPKLWMLTTNFISQIVLSKRYYPLDEDQETEHAKEYKFVFSELIFLLGSTLPGDCLPFLKWADIGGFQKCGMALKPRFDNIVTKILEERRAKRKEDGDFHVDVDIIDVLLTHQEKGEVPITEANIRGVIWDTFGGATETSISAIEWTMANLIKHPNLMQKVQSEIDNVVGKDNKVTENDIPKLHYLQAVVKENFRLHPPAPFLIPRESHTACKIAGYEIPTSTRMFVNVWGMGRDPCIWEDPLKFIPERFTKGSPLANLEVNGQHYQLMPFGTGRRQCPALSMGLATVTMLIANLVQAFDWSHLGGPNNLDMSESKSSWVTLMATPLQAIPKPRFPDEFY